MLSSGTMALRSACLLGSTGGWRGIIGVAVVELRGKKLGGREGGGTKTTINCKRGGRLVVVVVDLGGKGGVRSPPRHLRLCAAKDNDVGQREGRRLTTTISSLLSRTGGKGWQGGDR